MNKEQKKEKDLSPAKNVLVHSPGLSLTGEQRAAMTLSATACDDMPRVDNAGKTLKRNGYEVQVMHNGIQVLKGAYQGEWQAEVIEGQKGIHEPQEERVFSEVLKKISPGGVMLELGSWWSYYSMWFLKEIDRAKAICCEPDADNLEIGEKNMELNGFKKEEDFLLHRAAAGSIDKKKIKFRSEPYKDETQVTIRTVDSLLKEHGVDKLSILHLDIQGAELEALKGAEGSIKSGKVRFVFISTHHYVISDDPLMHQKCLDYVLSLGGEIIAEHTIAESSSGDGLIVASFDEQDSGFKVEVELQNSSESLFRQPERDVGVLWGEYNKLAERVGDMAEEVERRERQLRNLRQKLDSIYEHPIKALARAIYQKYIKRNKPE